MYPSPVRFGSVLSVTTPKVLVERRGPVVVDDPRITLPPQITQFCDVHSQCFEVHVEAQVANYKRQFTAIVGRKPPRDVQILSFYWK